MVFLIHLKLESVVRDLCLREEARERVTHIFPFLLYSSSSFQGIPKEAHDSFIH